MKILFQNRNPLNWIGGDMVQLEKTMQALRDKGIQVDFNSQPLYTPAIGLRNYDIVHLWNFSMPWTKLQLWAAKKHGLKTVCSMIYHEGEQFIPYNFQQIMWDHLDAPIFLAEGELDRVKRHVKIGDKKINFLPNGIEDFWFKYPKKKRDYVLTVARLEEPKGQLAVARACKKLGLRYVVVGETDKFPEFAMQLGQEGAEIWGKKTQEELVDVYAGAKLFVLASAAEIFPLTAMEAGAQAINIVMTDRCEWKDPSFIWCKHNDEKSIQKAILEGLKRPPNKDFQKRLKKMKWSNIAGELIKIYKCLLEG